MQNYISIGCLLITRWNFVYSAYSDCSGVSIDFILRNSGCVNILYTRKTQWNAMLFQQLVNRMCSHCLFTTCYKVDELNRLVTSRFNNFLSSCNSTVCQQVVSDNLLQLGEITALLQLVDKPVANTFCWHVVKFLRGYIAKTSSSFSCYMLKKNSARFSNMFIYTRYQPWIHSHFLNSIPSFRYRILHGFLTLLTTPSWIKWMF
jgi:hypothetical protein